MEFRGKKCRREKGLERKMENKVVGKINFSFFKMLSSASLNLKKIVESISHFRWESTITFFYHLLSLCLNLRLRLVIIFSVNFYKVMWEQS